MRILIIEDEQGVSKVLKHFLQPIASEIVVAANMEQALIAISDAEEIDIITLDLGLPDSGVEESVKQIKHIRALRPTALVVVVTGQDMPNLEKEVMESGADGIIFKQGNDFTAKGFLTFIQGLVKKYMDEPQHFNRSVGVLEKVSQKLAQLASNENRVYALEKTL